VGPVSLRQLN